MKTITREIEIDIHQVIFDLKSAVYLLDVIGASSSEFVGDHGYYAHGIDMIARAVENALKDLTQLRKDYDLQMITNDVLSGAANMHKVTDNLMQPYLKKGDYAIFEPHRGGEEFVDGVYVINGIGGLMIRRMQRVFSPNGYELWADDAKDNKGFIDEDEIGDLVVFIGRVTGRVALEE